MRGYNSSSVILLKSEEFVIGTRGRTGRNPLNFQHQEVPLAASSSPSPAHTQALPQQRDRASKDGQKDKSVVDIRN